MLELGYITHSINVIFQWQNIILMAAGVSLGIVVGALPGLTATMAVAVMLPFTFKMPADSGMLFLLGVYAGGIYGGSISAILVGVPGTPASAATVLDGYPLARQGKAYEALSMALWASVIGGVISGFILLAVAPVIAAFALRFGPPEIFALAVFGLTACVAGVASKNLVKGLMVAALGLIVSTIGLDPLEALPRFIFGIDALTAGIPLVPVLIGLFAIGEILQQVQQELHISVEAVKRSRFDLRLLLNHAKTIIKSSLIGTGIGAIPGTGAASASFLSYTEARRSSKHPECFGRGELDGVAASESGNNAVCGGAQIPLMTLGIPGDSVTAVLLGALMIQGLTPGPLLFERHGEYVYVVMIGFLVVNIIMLILGGYFIRGFSLAVAVPRYYLLPAIGVFSIVGAYAVNNSLFDVLLMLIFGVIGYILPTLGFSVTPLLLALILGPMAEASLRRSLILSGGSWAILVQRPIALAFLLLSVIVALFTWLQSRKLPKEISDDAREEI